VLLDTFIFFHFGKFSAALLSFILNGCDDVMMLLLGRIWAGAHLILNTELAPGLISIK